VTFQTAQKHCSRPVSKTYSGHPKLYLISTLFRRRIVRSLPSPACLGANMTIEMMLCCIAMQTLLHILIVIWVTVEIAIRVLSTTLDAMRIITSAIVRTARRTRSAVKCVLGWIDWMIACISDCPWQLEDYLMWPNMESRRSSSSPATLSYLS